MASKNTNINTLNAANDPSSDAFMTQLTKSLQSASGAISSNDTEIEKGISQAIKGTRQATEMGTARIESSFERQKTYAADAGSSVATSANEARRGFATNTGVMKQIYQETDKNLKDLEMRKQELILQGEAEGASTIAGLQIKQLEMRQEAQQRTYTNLLSLANFGMSAKQEKRQAAAQTFQEKQALASVGLQYGIAVEPGDTLDTMVAKAAATGMVSQKHQLELAKMTQDIAESKSRVNDMLKKGSAESANPNDIKMIAQMYANGSLDPNFIPKFDQKGLAIFAKESFDTTIENAKVEATSYTDKQSFLEYAVTKNIPYDKAQQIANQYVKPKEVKKTDWKGAARSFAGLFTPDF